jgi:hypothetical protein
MAADFSIFQFFCTVSCTIKSKVFVANTISDSLALLLSCALATAMLEQSDVVSAMDLGEREIWEPERFLMDAPIAVENFWINSSDSMQDTLNSHSKSQG